MNVNSNIISRYDDMLYENRPASLNEFLSNKYNNVHNELYKSALNKFILSLVSKYVTKDFLYECFELLSEIDAYTEDEIIFENIYEKIFSKENNSPLINYMLEELSIDRVSFFKTLYETTVNKLNSVKTKLINFYRDENYDIKSAIKGISEISDIHDFRLAYIISGIGSETNNERNIFTLYTDDDGELVVSNKVIFDDTTQEQEYINQDMYYYVGTEIPTEDMNIQTDERWYQCSDDGDIYNPKWEWSNSVKKYISDYYIAIPAGYGIYRHYLQSVEKERWNNQTLEYEKYQINAGDEIEQISLSAKSPYTFIKSIIIDKIVYNIYITTMNINEYNIIFNDVIKVNPESIVSNVIDDFDLICSEQINNENDYVYNIWDDNHSYIATYNTIEECEIKINRLKKSYYQKTEGKDEYIVYEYYDPNTTAEDEIKEHIIKVFTNENDAQDKLNEIITKEYLYEKENHCRYIVLYDLENNVRIGYDENGKWLLIVNDDHPINTIDILGLERIVKQYMNYESKTLSSLYKNMICDLYKKYHKIIEIKNSEYWMPSHIRIINKIPPYTKINVDLSKYWNMIQSNNTSKLSDLKITKENMLDSELIGLNYVNGKAKVQSRTNDTIYEVPFKYLDENVNVSDEMILSNSFISKYNNL